MLPKEDQKSTKTSTQTCLKTRPTRHLIRSLVVLESSENRGPSWFPRAREKQKQEEGSENSRTQQNVSPRWLPSLRSVACTSGKNPTTVRIPNNPKTVIVTTCHVNEPIPCIRRCQQGRL